MIKYKCVFKALKNMLYTACLSKIWKFYKPLSLWVVKCKIVLLKSIIEKKRYPI